MAEHIPTRRSVGVPRSNFTVPYCQSSNILTRAPQNIYPTSRFSRVHPKLRTCSHMDSPIIWHGSGLGPASWVALPSRKQFRKGRLVFKVDLVRKLRLIVAVHLNRRYLLERQIKFVECVRCFIERIVYVGN